MKIPETSANVGAYYGNEENGQWQPNGVIIDSGVGGGVVGSGDAGVHRPPVYPLHIPRGHIPGYVMAGAFYPPAPYGVAPPPAPAPDDFEDYMWMENEEEFDKQVMQQLEEEALMEQCIEAMLEDEQREQRSRAGKDQPTTSNGNPLSLEETVSRSTLNPLAAEFVPTGASSSARVPRPDPPPEEKAESPEAAPPRAEDSAPAPPEPDHAPDTDNKTEESPSPVEPPTASVADVSADKRPKDLKSKDTKPKDTKKPPAKVETKPKAKPLAVKSEPKVETKPKKKDAPRPARSDAAVHDTQPVDVPKPQPPTPTEETSPSPPGLKPINYAAAARANKPKAKPAAPAAPASAPAAPAVATKDKKPAEKPAKQKPTTDKPVQRKNSAK